MLIITEGSQTEPKLLKHLARCFQTLDKFEIYSYKTNIYDLYSYLEDYLVDGKEIDGDILQILVEREQSPSKRLVLQQSYSDILLVFDFESQDHRYDFTKLQTLLNIFNEANDEIIIIDNFANKELFDTLRSINKKIKIFSKNLDEILIKKYNEQYSNINFFHCNLFHDRYIILDRKFVYISGMSLKDIGKKYSYIK